MQMGIELHAIPWKIRMAKSSTRILMIQDAVLLAVAFFVCAKCER